MKKNTLKRKLLCLVLASAMLLGMQQGLTLQASAASGSWTQVGTAGFSSSTATYISMALDSNDTPYIAYSDAGKSGKATVKKYNGTAWETVGSTGFSAGVVYVISLAIDSEDTPYVAYQDGGNGTRMTAMKYNGTSWVAVGSAGFTTGSVDYASLAIGSDDTPYVAFRDAANNYGVTVMKYNGTAWETVGSAGFNGAQADHTSLALDSNDVPYVAFKDTATNSSYMTVMKYDGLTWEVVGSAAFSDGSISENSLKLDSNNTPYVAYKNDSSKTIVMKYNGTSWETVGGSSVSSSAGFYPSLAIDLDDTPYVSYQDGANSGKATVMKYTGSSWVEVGHAGFTSGAAPYTSIALDSDNTPYVAYEDGGNSNKASMMHFVIPVPLLTAGMASRSSETAATVTFTSDTAGTYYYEVVEDGTTPAPTVSTSGSGTSCGTTETTISLASLTDGAKDIYIVVKGEDGLKSTALQMDIPVYYTAILNITLNGSASSDPVTDTVKLYQSGTPKYTMTTSAAGVYRAPAAAGTYDVYVDGTDTGINLTASDDPVSVTLDYYEVNFSATDAGYAASSEVEATVDSVAIDTGDPVLDGKTVVFKAVGAGANSYTYLWSGTGTNNETDQTYSLAVSSASTVACTVTGINKATVTVQLDGSASLTPVTGTVNLYKNDAPVCAMSGSAGVYTANFAGGTYDVYINGEDTGEDLTISNGTGSATVDYYTVNFGVTDAGDASGSSIAATAGSSDIYTGDIVLGGKAVVITATGAGASIYDYAWSGTGTSGETGTMVSISSLSSAVNANCVVTGTMLYEAVVTVQLDGNKSSGPVTGNVELYQGNSPVYSVSPSATVGVYTKNAGNGTYDVYINGEDTGENLVVSDGTGSATVDYYTVSFSVTDAGTASGSTITATAGDSDISSGDIVLGGTVVDIAATGAGAGYYTYAWAGTGTSGETGATVSISSLSSTVGAACTVTGFEINIDTDNDGTPDLNLDTDNDGIPDLNLDTDNDGVADVNIDTDNDGVADLNIDTDNDGEADVNIDTDNDGVADVNLDTDNDSEADVNIDTDNDGVADVNLDTDNDGVADMNIDTDNDGEADVNIDTDNDGVADLNVDTDNDGEADVNIDTGNDGVADQNLVYHLLSYNGNGSESGTVPPSESFLYGTSATVSGNTGSLARSGYTFSGWNTNSTGDGTSYASSTEISILNEDITLYVLWTKSTGGDDSDDRETSVDKATTDTKTGTIDILLGQPDGTQTAIKVVTERSSTDDGRTELSADFTPESIYTQLEQYAQTHSGSTLRITLEDADDFDAKFTAQTVEELATNKIKIDMSGDEISYFIPASAIDVDKILTAMGSDVAAADVEVKISVRDLSADEQASAEEILMTNGYELVLEPVCFEIKAVYGDTEYTYRGLSNYATRYIKLPDTVADEDITTAVVVEEDGSTRHVPTRITMIDGVRYVEISSLSNSVYALISNERTFGDINGHWAGSEINDMASRTVIDSAVEGRYEPDGLITRAEFTVLLVTGLGIEPSETTVVFSDVTSDLYGKYIQAAYEYGIINGNEDGTFQPDEAITREQAFAMLSRAMSITGITEEISEATESEVLEAYSDAEMVGEYFDTEVAQCIKSGIVSGRDSTNIAPKDKITRAEATVITYRLLLTSDLISAK